MTQQETFKRRIRHRMAKTGERYTAARRSLISSAGSGSRVWVAEPEVNEDRVREATSRGWDEWCDIIDGWPGKDDGHSAIAAYIQDEFEVDGWWAQTVTVGYERITGRRLPHQKADGTFTAGKSRTVTVDRNGLRAMLLSDDDRSDLFPGLETILRSRPTAKVLRIGIGPGVAQIAMDPAGDGRVKISIAHEKLPNPQAVGEWKAYWSDWLEAVDEARAAD